MIEVALILPLQNLKVQEEEDQEEQDEHQPLD